MADKLLKIDYLTNINLEELDSDKELILLKAPKFFDPKLLQDKTVKLKTKGLIGSIGKELLSLSNDIGSYNLNIAQKIHTNFNVTFSTQDKGLRFAKPIAYELEIVQNVAAGGQGEEEDDREFEQYLEPYVPLPQVKGLKVRFKPGGGSGCNDVAHTTNKKRKADIKPLSAVSEEESKSKKKKRKSTSKKKKKD